MPALHGGSRGAPGKFYGNDSALILLTTLRASGATAHVAVDESATLVEREHFKHFSARLQKGDIVSDETDSPCLLIQFLLVCCYGWHPYPPFLLLR